ncbi:bifunctional AMP-binding enzyme [Babesia duncani]|uniref:Acetyl-coenzyme A synthetase n=1 Tax=Babesia duncani TaxID=323732 RepID=A0AAD9PNL6_9APIC|nr:bifunctional AMP-binding enzyme [Babesia duncani]
MKREMHDIPKFGSMPSFEEGSSCGGFDTQSIYPICNFKDHVYNISSLTHYKELHAASMANPDIFWGEFAKENLHWFQPFDKVSDGSLENMNYTWFLNGKLNACYNCVDVWAEKRPDSCAIIFEGDDENDAQSVTYRQLKDEVCKVANVLKSARVKKGDTVTIYMPNSLELCYVVLACARIGAIHSVVFGGFSAASLAERIQDAESRVIVTVDQAVRGGKQIHMKEIVDEALGNCAEVTTCFVYRLTNALVSMQPPRDIWMNEAIANARPFCPVEWMDSEDILFLLYTSGSTGKPKGLAHSTGGYLVYACATTRYIFDTRQGDVFACMADAGWITGHSYVIYGPLLNGLTTFVFGSLPTYPDPGRYWRMVQRYKMTQFYTAPTAIRTLMRFGNEHPKNYDLSSLRVLGSVGEPINPEAWRWYHEFIGGRKAAIVDTYWQTETGGIVVAPLPGAIETKAGSATFPFFGIDVALLDPNTGTELQGSNVQGLLMIKRPWPGMFRTIWKNHQRVKETYFCFPGYYMTGDAAFRDDDGYIWMCGRVDDIINVSGHRIGSAEIEHALVQVPIVAEAAVVGCRHAIKGQGIFCFVTLKNSALTMDQTEMSKTLKQSVRALVGPIATPDVICMAPNLPKTRSGKIMRRVLRKLVQGATVDQLGDTSTLADVSVLGDITQIVTKALGECPYVKCSAKNA